MGGGGSKPPECQHCETYSCAAAPYSPASSPDGQEVLWMLPNNADPPPGAQGWVSMPVCTQPDGTQGVIDFYGTASKGCVTANALCCGGSETQCMVDNKDGGNQSKSQIGHIVVPCGVEVAYSYDGTCNFTDTPVTHMVGSGIPKVLVCDPTTNTTCPYSYQFSLAPGYECKDGDLVIESTDKKPCVHGGSNTSFTTHGASGGMFGLSKKDMLIAVGVGGVVLIILMYVVFNRKPTDLLTVKQIVQHAGINEHLVIPGEAKKAAKEATKAAAKEGAKVVAQGVPSPKDAGFAI